MRCDCHYHFQQPTNNMNTYNLRSTTLKNTLKNTGLAEFKVLEQIQNELFVYTMTSLDNKTSFWDFEDGFEIISDKYEKQKEKLDFDFEGKDELMRLDDARKIHIIKVYWNYFEF